jgi:ADP-heptose:LPS heptosyltransferase
MGIISQDKRKKILIIRFSAIGDVVLTSPIIRVLKMSGYEVHYLVKRQFKSAIQNNQYIDKLFTLEEAGLKKRLRLEKYGMVIDLQNNLKSLKIRSGLSKDIKIVNKENLKKLVLVRAGLDLLNSEHIVDRYFKAIENTGVKNDGKGLDFYLSDDFKISLNKTEYSIEQAYIAWIIGASYPKKTLPSEHIIQTCNVLKIPVMLLGGVQDEKKGAYIVSTVIGKNVHNLCGKLSLEESAFMVKKASLVLSNDTGLMHIAAAYQKDIISFWGCTKPSLGMFPYKPGERSEEMISPSQKAPCSKLGNRCKSDKNGCIQHIQVNDIIFEIKKVLPEA